MRETRVASRYAASLLDLALENNLLDKVTADVQLINATINENKELRVLLGSPIIKEDKKTAILREIFGKKVTEPTLKFLELIAKKRREANLLEVGTEFLNLVNSHKGIQRVIVTTAVGLDDKLRKEVLDIVRKSTDSEIELVENIDKKILGGFILQIGDQHIDSSIVRSIKRLRRNFSDNPYNKEI